VRRGALLLTALCLGLLPGAADARDPSYVQVVEKEWSLVFSRQSVRSGTVILEVINFGMDAHNLAVRKHTPGATTIRFAKLFHGARADRTLRLVPGRYTLWCTLPGHRGRGMTATLLVTR
jgi:hypothetical protein